MAAQTFLLGTWNIRASDGHGSESGDQDPQSNIKHLKQIISMISFTKCTAAEMNGSVGSTL